ncbi:negative transcriptional regulator, PaiB family [Lacicoccus qingdaonensis]|uniref:Negative transcriptional regulator, PaiB family n=1 Tax=Lacicoccus qingdaonensis TaxID=576118 RepID=A0A1G9BP40_9BACL|nr:FMN-binding negative transcriptional regulator [Salinicoccus qingdaonensis]SDK40635.1 negative transcriptional regulator, PaiB family [Salinicoccus qingdaonensis]
MYIPKHFKVDDLDEIKDFIINNDFGTIITTDNNRPVATHTPMMLNEENGEWTLTGHISKGNGQWQTFDGHENTLLIFKGPDAYISSTWYEGENVPTWNYESVHLYGSCSLLSEDELERDLINLLDKYEGHDPEGATWDNISDDTRKQIRGIAGFKVKVKEVQAAYKMSQNRNETDYHNVIASLEERNMGDDQEISREMKRIRDEK